MTVQRTGQYRRGSENHFILAGRLQTEAGIEQDTSVVRIPGTDCSTKVLDLLCLVQEGDTLTLGYELAHMGGSNYCKLYNVVALVRLGSPGFSLIADTRVPDEAVSVAA